MSTDLETKIAIIESQLNELKLKVTQEQENKKFEKFIDDEIRPNIDYYNSKKVIYIHLKSDNTYEVVNFSDRYVFFSEIGEKDINKYCFNDYEIEKLKRLNSEFAVFEIVVKEICAINEKFIKIKNVYAIKSVELNCACKQ